MSRTLVGIALLMALMCTFSGCQWIDQLMGKTGEETEVTEDETLEDEEALISEEEALFDNGPKALMDNFRPLEVTTTDGMTLKGLIYVPGLSPYEPPSEEDLVEEEEEEEEGAIKKPVKPAKVQYPLVVLFHMLSGDTQDWKEYPRQLVKAGYAVLVFDQRGHGESVYQGKRLRSWRQFDKNDWHKMPSDLTYFLNSISTTQELNGVNTQKLALIGASIGANVAVNYASKHPNQVKAMVLLSPGLEYHGIETFTPLTHYENAVYFAASKEDAYAADSVERLYKFAQGKKKIQIFQNLGHGTDILHANADMGKEIVVWLRGIVPPPEGVGEAPEMPTTTPAAGAEDGKTTPTPSTKPSDKDKDKTKTNKDAKDKDKDKAKTSPTPTKKPTPTSAKLSPSPTKAPTSVPKVLTPAVTTVTKAPAQPTTAPAVKPVTQPPAQPQPVVPQPAPPQPVAPQPVVPLPVNPEPVTP